MSVKLLPVCNSCGKIIEKLECSEEILRPTPQIAVTTVAFSPPFCPFCGEEILEIGLDNKFVVMFQKGNS